VRERDTGRLGQRNSAGWGGEEKCEGIEN